MRKTLAINLGVRMREKGVLAKIEFMFSYFSLSILFTESVEFYFYKTSTIEEKHGGAFVWAGVERLHHVKLATFSSQVNTRSVKN